MLLYIMLHIMLLAALSNAVFLHNAFFPLNFVNAFVFNAFCCLGLLTHTLFISCINLHHAKCI